MVKPAVLEVWQQESTEIWKPAARCAARESIEAAGLEFGREAFPERAFVPGRTVVPQVEWNTTLNGPEIPANALAQYEELGIEAGKSFRAKRNVWWVFETAHNTF